MGLRELKIFYVGEKSGTALHRANALSRLGHEVEICNPNEFLPKNRNLRRFHWETGALFIGKQIDSKVIGVMGDRKFDVLWVDHGRYTGANLVHHSKNFGAKTVVINVDDPFGFRDRLSWLQYRKNVKEYDLVVVFREPNVEEAKAYGAKAVQRVRFSADEIAHAALPLTPKEVAKYSTDILFIGTWMVGRGKFMLDLRTAGLKIAIIGDRWQKAPEWPEIMTAWRAPGVYGNEYAAYIQCSKICIGLLSEQNRDLHTTRSAEIPAIGSLLCARRTTEHVEFYEDGVEAVFWEDSAECARRCQELLASPESIARIAAAGHARCLANGTMNEPVMQSILDRLFQTK